MKPYIISIVLVLCCLPSFAADTITGETEAHADPQARISALKFNALADEHARHCADMVVMSVRVINEAGAVVFWDRVGTKGRRTLKFITDILADMDKIDSSLVQAPMRLEISKWKTNPDNTVSVSP